MNWDPRPGQQRIGSQDELPRLHVTVDAEGIQQAIDARFNALAGLQNIILTSESLDHTMSEMAQIAKIQKAAGRNPWYVSTEGWQKISTIIHDHVRAPEYPLNRKEMLKAICDALVEDVQAHFRDERNPDGSTFSALTPAYEREKKHAVGDKPILTRTGDLVNGIRARPTDLIK